MPYFWPLLPAPPGPSTTVTPFIALQGVPRKAEEIKKFVPEWMETRYPSIIGAILHGMGIEDHRVTVGEHSLFIRGVNPAGNVLYVAKLNSDSIRVKHFFPISTSSPLSISVSGKDILVTLETDGAGAPLTTAAQLRVALAANTAANALVGLTTFGAENELVGKTNDYFPLDLDGLEGAARNLFLNYARGQDLSIIANNYGIPKPTRLSLKDTNFRQYIAALAFRKKCGRGSIEDLLTAIFGPRETAGWAVYETKRKTITVEVTEALLKTGPDGSTYLRALSTTVSKDSHTGDYLRTTAVEPAFGRVKATSGSALSTITNNSVYLRLSGANRPILLEVMRLVRAAGVQVEFVQRKG